MIIRPYRPEDEQQWLRCRVLSFLDTSYCCDVRQKKECYAHPAIELVAEQDGCLVGLIDVETDSNDLTRREIRGAVLQHLAVLPEFRRHGIATALWERTKTCLRAQNIRHCEVWTQEDESANRFYRAMGFELQTEHCWLRCEASADACDRLLRTGIDGAAYGAECFVFDAPSVRRDALTHLCSKMTEVRLYSCDL